MKKTAAVLAITFAICLLLGLGVFASRSDFVIEGGVLKGYNGGYGDVIVPEDVYSIDPGVFPLGSVSSVTVLNSGCNITSGAIASGVPIHGYAGSTAETYAADVLSEFTQITGKPMVTVTINYLKQDGSAASESFEKQLGVYSEDYIMSPAVAGYTPDIPTVHVVTEDSNVVIVVTYTKNVDPETTGWKIDGTHIRFYDSAAGGYLTSVTKSIDGVERTFDENGFLVGSGSTVTVNGSTYYLLYNVICYGSVRIGDGIYYFDAEGKMVKGQTVDGNSYDAEGRLTIPGQLIALDGSTYFLSGNSLYTGFLQLGEDIYCFGDDDYAMKVGVTADGCTFDAEGRLSSVSANQLEFTYDETRTYNKLEQKPPVEVFLKGVKLTENVHYTVEYADNINPGEGKIIITGMGPVLGSVEKTFEIVGKETFTLTVRYQNARGYEMHEPYVAELEGGAHYSVNSPEINGYKPDQDKVEGDIRGEDVTVIVTYVSEKDGETETEPVETEPTETERQTEQENEDNKQDEQKTKRIYKYDFKLFFTVAAIATLVVAIAIFLIVWFGKKRRNPPAAPDEDDPDDGSGDEGPVDPIVGAVPEEADEDSGETADKSKTMKFDLNEIELEDFEEAKPVSDFVDLYEFSLGDAPEAHKAPATPKRYHFRKK